MTYRLDSLLKGMDEIITDYPVTYLKKVEKEHYLNRKSFFPCGDGRWKTYSNQIIEFPKDGIMMVGSDWGIEDEAKEYNNGAEFNSATFRGIGDVFKKHQNWEERLFFTNAIMGLRTGDLKDSNMKLLPIWSQLGRKSDFYKQNIKFFEFQLEVVKPKIIIGLGVKVWNFFGDVFGNEELKKAKNFKEIGKEIKVSFNNSELTVFVIFHPSYRNLNRINNPVRAKMEDDFLDKYLSK